jgi:hypothetical protein
VYQINHAFYINISQVSTWLVAQPAVPPLAEYTVRSTDRPTLSYPNAPDNSVTMVYHIDYKHPPSLGAELVGQTMLQLEVTRAAQTWGPVSLRRESTSPTSQTASLQVLKDNCHYSSSKNILTSSGPLLMAALILHKWHNWYETISNQMASANKENVPPRASHLSTEVRKGFLLDISHGTSPPLAVAQAMYIGMLQMPNQTVLTIRF